MESRDGRYLYYLKADSGNRNSLWKMPLGGGDEAQVLESVLNNNYAVVDRGIYFIPDSKPFAVRFLSFDTGKVVTIARIAREPAFGFSVSPDGRSLLYSEFEAVRSDLMLVENFR
jgi:Tol biopolymer transport system component